MPPAKKAAGLVVGVVGATGMVGGELVSLLEKRRFPVGTLKPFSSGRVKKSVRFRGRAIPAPAVDKDALAACDVVFFVSADEVSLEFAPDLAKRGVWCIDDSAAFRLDPSVPLVIPEVNFSAITPETRLIAGPNCTMTGLAVAAWPLHKAGTVTQARVASYQAVSGAGRAALEEFFAQNKAVQRELALSGWQAPLPKHKKSKALPSTIACNVIPQVGRFDAAGSCSEENKVAAELRKIWSAPNLRVSATTVRVPVVRGHSLSAWLTLEKPLSPAQARTLIGRQPGAELSPEGRYPTPLDAAGREPVLAGRVRAGATADELCLWIVSDNLLKGAALNSVQVAEELLRRKWLSPRA